MTATQLFVEELYNPNEYSSDHFQPQPWLSKRGISATDHSVLKWGVTSTPFTLGKKFADKDNLQYKHKVRWEYCFSLKGGTPRLYAKIPGRRPQPNKPHIYHIQDVSRKHLAVVNDLDQKYVAYIKDFCVGNNLGKPFIADYRRYMFPLLNTIYHESELIAYGEIGPYSARHFRHTDNLKDFCSAAFKSTDRRLLRVVGRNLINGLQPDFALAFVGYIDINHIISYLEAQDSNVTIHTRQMVERLRRMIRLSSPTLRRRLLLPRDNGQVDDLRQIISDTIRMYNRTKGLANINGNSWLEIHNRMARELGDWVYEPTRRELLDSQTKIKYATHLQSLLDLPVGDMVIHGFASVADVQAAGRDMGNCIATYAPEAVGGRTGLFWIERNGKMVYNFEIDRDVAVQLSGKFNNPPQMTDALPILEALEAKGVDVTTLRRRYERKMEGFTVGELRGYVQARHEGRNEDLAYD